MTLEEKELLLKDLCARLPYEVMVDYNGEAFKLLTISDYRILVNKGRLEEHLGYSVKVEYEPKTLYLEDVKPYLRPMSSMTEEEMDMVEEIMQVDINRNIIFDFMANGDTAFQKANISIARFGMLIDFLNKQMLDWRGLIQKGLALEALEGMYNIK